MSIRFMRNGEVRISGEHFRHICNELRLARCGSNHWKQAEHRVARLCRGAVASGYAASHDVLTPWGQTIQVKSAYWLVGQLRLCFSNASTNCDWLVLTAGVDDTFVYWLIPRSDLKRLVPPSGYIQISTDPDVASNKRFAPYMVPETGITGIDDHLRSSFGSSPRPRLRRFSQSSVSANGGDIQQGR